MRTGFGRPLLSLAGHSGFEELEPHKASMLEMDLDPCAPLWEREGLVSPLAPSLPQDH